MLKTIAPGWALKRAQNRQRLNLMTTAMAGDGGYEGAKKRGIFKNWKTSKADAFTDVNQAAPIIRERARDLDKNNPIAHGALATKKQYVIGGGLSPEPSIDHEFLGFDVSQAEKINDAIKRVFMEFAENKKSDWLEQKNFFQKQAEVYHSKNLNGVALVVLKHEKEKGQLCGHRLHSIEIDRVSNPDNQKDSDTLKSGIQFDARGRIEKLHIAKTHPGKGAKKLPKGNWQSVKRERENGWPNFLFINHKNDRPEQVMGLPDLTPVISAIKQMGAYIDAELLGTLISNKFTVFVKSNTPGALNGLAPGAGSQPLAQPAPEPAPDDDGDMELGDGLIVQLGRDEDVTIADPTRPNPNMGPFLDKMTSYIGAAIGLPFELLMKHFTASYSASKAALLMFANWLAVERLEFVREFCRPIYEMVIDEAVAEGRLNLPGYFSDPYRRRAYLGCAWHGAPLGDIDEVKAATAAKIRLETQTTNKTVESRKIGLDQDQIRQGRATEKMKDQRAGVSPSPEKAQPYEAITPTNDIDKEE